MIPMRLVLPVSAQVAELANIYYLYVSEVSTENTSMHYP